MMRKRIFFANAFFTFSALFGLAVSLLLVSEFFGLSTGAVRAICTHAKSGINSCRTVAESPYAIIGIFPVLGQLPTAAIGVMFYSFAALIGTFNFYKKENVQLRLLIGLLLSIAGILADAALYFISIFKIKAVCTLCSISYCATLGMFISSAVALNGFNIKSIIEKTKKYILVPLGSEIIAIACIAILSFTAGISSTAITRNQFETYAHTLESQGKILTAYRSAKLYSIDITGAPFSGNAIAPIQMVLFVDFTCDHCMQAGKTISALLTEFPDKIKVFYKLYPLCGECPPRQGTAIEPCCIAALAASCAHREGKFFAAYDALYANLEAGIEHSSESMQSIQNKIGLRDSFSSCISSFNTAAEINRDTEEGVRLHLTGTPALFVNGRRIPNEFIHLSRLRELILHLMQ